MTSWEYRCTMPYSEVVADKPRPKMVAFCAARRCTRGEKTGILYKVRGRGDELMLLRQSCDVKGTTCPTCAQPYFWSSNFKVLPK